LKYLVWLLKAAIFFTLFAFALNNQQDVTVNFFFGSLWRAPLVLVVLAAFALGLAVGALGMVPRWWKHRRAARRGHPAEPASSVLDPGAFSHHGLLFQLAALGAADRVRAGLARVALRPAPTAHRESPGAQGLLSGPQLPAERA